MPSLAFLSKSGQFLRPQSFKCISTFVHLSQEAQLADAPTLPPPLPPNPASGSPLYQENWRNPSFDSSTGDGALIPVGLGFLQHRNQARTPFLSESLDNGRLMNEFANWMTSQNWEGIKQLFEIWVKSLDQSGKPNMPDVNLYNHYLRANLMLGASAGELLDLVTQMDQYEISPNTASYNLVLKAMQKPGETLAAEKLIERMLLSGKEYKESLPDEESYDLVIDMFLSRNQLDSALKYIDLTLKSGFILSKKAFTDCIRCCVKNLRLDTLVSFIERCKKTDQNKSLLPTWKLCTDIADVALQSDNCHLTNYALEFMAKWIARGEVESPSVLLSVDQGLIVSALGTAGRTFNSKLLDYSWSVLRKSLRQKKVADPELYLAKIYGHANLGNLQKAFSTLHEFETAYGNSNHETPDDLFSPFYCLNPLVLACSKNGFTTLDSFCANNGLEQNDYIKFQCFYLAKLLELNTSNDAMHIGSKRKRPLCIISKVYYQLENLSQANLPYKSVAALNCIVLGCANIWDVDRAYQTFNAIDASFKLTPNIHSYNALICAFGKLSKRDEAVKVFEHFLGLGVKPNATTYSLLVDAHLIKKDPKAALYVIDEMVSAGYEPTKEILKKVRRRCVREMDYESNDKVGYLAGQFKIRLGTENRRDLLFNLKYSADYT